MLESLLKRLPPTIKDGLRRYEPDEVGLVHRLIGDRREAVMIDVGACLGSSLAAFARSGWMVYAFEPDVVNRTRLAQAWADESNVHIDPRAVSETEEPSRSFYRSDVSHGISGLSAFHESHELAGTVEVTTLDVAMQDYGIEHIDFLKIDTEGHDLLVLRGFDWASAPDVIVCEFEDAKTVPLGYTYRDLADYLVGKGYEVVTSEWFPVVEYGMQHRWRRFARYPADLADSDGWGNLIAVHDSTLTESLMREVAITGRRWRFGGSLTRALKS